MNIPFLHRPSESPLDDFFIDDIFIAVVAVLSVLCFVGVLFGMS